MFAILSFLLWVLGALPQAAPAPMLAPALWSRADTARAVPLAAVGRGGAGGAALWRPGPPVFQGSPVPPLRQADGYATGAHWPAVPVTVSGARLAVTDAQPPGTALRF